jgi:hypothetical protein
MSPGYFWRLIHIGCAPSKFESLEEVGKEVFTIVSLEIRESFVFSGEDVVSSCISVDSDGGFGGSVISE